MAPRAMKRCNEAWVAPIMRCNLGLWRHADGLFEGISRGYARGQESGE